MGTFLLYLEAYESFVAFSNLLSYDFFDDLLSMKSDRQQRRFKILYAVIDENSTGLTDRMNNACLLPEMFFLEWGVTLFSKRLQPEVTARVWDVVFVYGEEYIYKIAAAMVLLILKNHETLDDDDIRTMIRKKPSTLGLDELFTAV